MDSLSRPCKGNGVDVVALFLEKGNDFLPRPPTQPRPWRKEKPRHPVSPRGRAYLKVA